METGVPP